MKLPKARGGTQLVVKGRPITFSHWPMKRTNRRYGLSDEVFTTAPWSIIEAAIRDRCPSGAVETAESFLRQAREYGRAAASAHAQEALPVLHYYSFLNLGKALVLTNKVQPGLPRVMHGLKEDWSATSTVPSAVLKAERSSPTNKKAFDEFLAAVGAPRLSSATTHLSVLDLFAQSVVGHRLWRTASGRKERLARISEIKLWEDPTAKDIWATIELNRASIRAMGRSRKELLELGGLSGSWRAVADSRPDVVVLEQTATTSFTHRAADKVQAHVEKLRWTFPRVFSPIPGYRAYYLYLAPTGSYRLPQPAASYAAMFWLGSITRYRPHVFLEAMRGPFGPFLSEFLAVQPTQFLYECACLFLKREVTQAAVVT